MGNVQIKDKQEFVNFETIQDSLGLNNPLLFKKYLKEVFNDLGNSVNKQNIKFISRMAFYDYIKLPIFIAEKLFISFSKSSTQGLCEEEFVDNFFKLYMGSFEDTINIIFNLLDFDKDGIIKKDDVKIVLSYLPLNEQNDELLGKLEKLKSSLGNKLNDSVSKITGKIGANNPIGFVNKLITQKQDQDSRVALKEFLNLIERKKINITDANINGLIDWLLKTPKLEEEQTNKYVGTCIGLVVSLNKQLIEKYIELVKQNEGFKKASLLNGAKEIFKSKQELSNTILNSLYQIILEGIKNNERLIKEHSMQALNSVQFRDSKDLLNFYQQEDIRKIIQQSCKIDKAYIKEADFGEGNKIVEDKGVGIRRRKKRRNKNRRNKTRRNKKRRNKKRRRKKYHRRKT